MLIVYADGIGTAKIPPEDERSILLTVAKACAESLRGKGHHVGVLKAEWPASMATVGGPLSWVNAAYRGVLAVDNILADHPGEKIILLGYSGGCRVVHDWLDTRHAAALCDALKAGGADVVLKVFAAAETAAAHGQSDNPTLGNEFVFDWIASRLVVVQASENA